MNPRLAIWRILAVLLLAAALGWPAQAAEAVTISDVAVGIGGSFKAGHWTPVRVTLRKSAAATARLVLTTVDADGLSTRYDDETPLNFTGEALILWRYVKFGHRHGSLQVQLMDEQKVLSQRTLSASEVPEGLLSTSELLVTVGKDVGVAEAVAMRSSRTRRPAQAAFVAGLADLPDHWLGYEAIDTLVLPTSQLDWSTVPQPQLDALRQWVHLGGRMILSVGREGEQLFGPQGLLQEFAPGEYDRTFAQWRTGALEAYVGAAQRLDAGSDPRRFSYDMTLFQSVRGRVEASEAGPGAEPVPLVINYPVGFGQVTLLTFDLDRPPVSAWNGRARLLHRLLAFHQAGETGRETDKELQLPAQLGYSDLAGQLRTALDQFPGVRLVAFSWVATLVVIYILLIGPADYFFLKFTLGRMTATWLTLPLVSLAFLGLAWWLGDVWKADDLRLNQASVVDIDLASGQQRGIAWTHVYSPTTASYDFQPEFTDEPAGAVVAWQGLPGVGLGGLDGRAAPNLFDLPYTISMAGVARGGAPGIHGIPITAAATRSFTARWWHAQDISTSNQLQATGDGLIEGQFTYPLDIELEETALLYENWLFRIPGKLQPGETIRLADLSSPRNLLWQLAQKRTVESKDVITPWNARELDTERIVQVMLLHRAAGGNNYTGLSHSYFHHLDLSHHLQTGRAILIGRTARRPVRFAHSRHLAPRDAAPHAEREALDDAYDQSVTFYRLVLPVGEPGG